MNELSENASFDSEFAVVFEIQPFEVAIFVFLKPISFFTQDMKDDKKLSTKHIKIQMTQPSFKNALVKKAAQYNYFRRCIDSLLQTVKPIK